MIFKGSKPKILVLFSLIIFLFLTLYTLLSNRHHMDVDDQDLNILKNFYGSYFEINTFNDILNAQRHTLDKIPHDPSQRDKIPHGIIKDHPSQKLLTVEKAIKVKIGNCYHRSFLLQKLMIANGLRVKPIYLFHGKNNTRPFDFFKKNINSHAVFKVEIDKKWVIIETNMRMEDQYISSIKQYLDYDFGVVPNHSLYIQHLASRHGNFIGPAYLPDFY